MVAQIIDGKAYGEKLKAQIAAEVADLVKNGKQAPCVSFVLVGDDPASHYYINSKAKTCENVGIKSRDYKLPADTDEATLLRLIARLNDDKEVHGILVQIPLPAHLNEEAVLDLIPAVKDVDGLTTASLGRLVRGLDGHVGCTPLGVMRLLEYYGITTSGKRAVVVGRSTLVGYPLSILLARKGIDCTVTLAHSRTPNLAAVCREADILISATGMARSITAEFVRPGACVIDVGISRTENGIVGDVDFDSVKDIASAITPMPGGTGVMTVACLLENTLSAARMQGVAV